MCGKSDIDTVYIRDDHLLSDLSSHTITVQTPLRQSRNGKRYPVIRYDVETGKLTLNGKRCKLIPEKRARTGALRPCIFPTMRVNAMKRLLLSGVAALFLATGTAHAVEWQCGPHYVSTMVLHKENLRYAIIAYPFYNRTREDVIKNKLPSGGDDELVLPHKNFRWGYAPHPEFRGQRLLTYRGKPCFLYPIETQQ